MTPRYAVSIFTTLLGMYLLIFMRRVYHDATPDATLYVACAFVFMGIGLSGMTFSFQGATPHTVDRIWLIRGTGLLLLALTVFFVLRGIRFAAPEWLLLADAAAFVALLWETPRLRIPPPKSGI